MESIFVFTFRDVTGDYMYLKAITTSAPKLNTALLFSEFKSLLFACRKL